MKSDSFKFYFLVALFIASIISSSVFFSLSKKKSSNKTSPASTEVFKFSNNFVSREDRDGILELKISGGISFSQETSSFGLNAPDASRWISIVDMARKDEKILGLLLRINSGGGNMVASQELYNAIKRFRESGKKVVVSIAEVCASGAYYVASPADVIVANEGSIVGSIGVFMQTLDATELLKKIGVKPSVIKSVEYKDILSPARTMTAYEKEALQKTVDALHEQFVSSIVKWRASYSSEKTIRNAANGLVYVADVAKGYGLVDKLGDREQAKKEIASLTQLDYENLVIYDASRYYKTNEILNDIIRSIPLSSVFSKWLKNIFLESTKQSIAETLGATQGSDQGTDQKLLQP